MGADRSTTVEIEKLVYGGDGLARVEGKVVLVPFVLPGERVEVKTVLKKGGVWRGSGPHVVAAGDQRVKPRCEYFSECGGCHYQHSTYEYQLQQKQAILRESLKRLGGLDYTAEIHVISGDPWHYRNRVQLHFEGGRAGFWRAESHSLCAIDHCYISSPVLNEVMGQMQTMTRRAEWPKFLRSLEVFTNESDVQFNVVETAQPVAIRFFEWCRTFIPKLADNAIDYAAGGHQFRISRGSFFQVNRYLIDRLVEEVTGGGNGTSAIDLYAGAGLFSFALAARFQKVDAVERGSAAFRDLLFNAERNGLEIHAVQERAEEFLRSVEEVPDLIVADPPRAGLGKECTEELLRIAAQRIVLVSCDPATLARDLHNLAGQYEIERMTLIDLFPQTYHLETVVHLMRKTV